MRCDQCRHWDLMTGEGDWRPKNIGFGSCTAVRPEWEIEKAAVRGKKTLRRASETVNYWEDRELLEKDALVAARAHVVDGSEYHAELRTGPNFFCALFKQKGKRQGN